MFAAIILWTWIFGFITDTTADKKVVLFADVPKIESVGLSSELEKNMPDGLKMIKTYSFSYALMSETEILASDLYIVKGEDFEKYRDSFAPLSGEYMQLNGDPFIYDGKVYGYKVFDKETGEGIADEYIVYDPTADYYLFFNTASVHTLSLGSGADDKALSVAGQLLLL